MKARPDTLQASTREEAARAVRRIIESGSAGAEEVAAAARVLVTLDEAPPADRNAARAAMPPA